MSADESHTDGEQLPAEDLVAEAAVMETAAEFAVVAVPEPEVAEVAEPAGEAAVAEMSAPLETVSDEQAAVAVDTLIVEAAERPDSDTDAVSSPPETAAAEVPAAVAAISDEQAAAVAVDASLVDEAEHLVGAVEVAEPPAESETPRSSPEPAPAEITASIEAVSGEQAAVAVRTAIVEEAERLSGSEEWSKASNGFRELLERWRAVGSAGRAIDDVLWARFETARDAFFQRRNAHHAERSRLLSAAADRKRELIAECERLLELGDPRKIGEGLDRLMGEWKAAGRAGNEDQALWHQFRGARERVFALRREAAAARQRRREEIKAGKEALIEEAKALATLATEGLQEALDRSMTAWKQAGSAGKDADDELWGRFREARGAAFGRLRQLAVRAEREAARAAQSAERAVFAAQRAAFSGGAVSETEVEKLKQTFARAADTVGEEVREQFQEAVGRLSDRAKESASAIPGTNPLGMARVKLEITIRELEERVEQFRAAGSRELARAEKRLAEERQKLERMLALIGR